MRGTGPGDAEQRRRVVLVEDRDDMAALLATLLELERFEVITVNRDGPVAELIELYEPHVVILNLARLDSRAEQIREALLSRWPALPVLFAWLDLDGDPSSGRGDPFEFRRLLFAIRQVLR